ncbi:2-phosphosulfolactate phosphatase [uncultured Draconibacterium sp.]|uniref:2-phosphosulfolactate phosphatase n=1 Tax=uncultured Draconibacterium sp. TaxID=1573823 RepID=UPI0025D3C5B9|nr:2-phosphosulfolactate phosphatase [uncultured Draconibacterium sp.]
MKIRVLHLLKGAKEASGLTVIIDVFRAFSTACFAFDKGVETIFPVAGIDEAREMKKNNPDFVLVGERDGKKISGFDFGNSPSHILSADLKNKTLVHTTSSGTQGIANAKSASEIITGSFVNADAIVQYIKKKKPETVSLVCMGYACIHPTDEDNFCAEYIKNKLENRPGNFEKMVEKLKVGSGARFFKPENQSWSPKTDFELCLDINRFDFVLKAENRNELNYLKKIEV